MRNYKRKSRWVNLDGYTDGSSNSLNNSNIIPTNQITMRNTSQPLYGQGIDQNGYPITDRVYMEPGNNYNFDGASAVFEEPVYQGGGYYIDMPFDNQVQGFNPQNYNTNYNDPFRQFNPRQFNFSEYEHPIPTYSAPATVETETVGGTYQSAGQTTEGKTEQERFQFYNPYAGVDLGGASTMFGKSLAEGNTFGAIASGLKVGTGLARNVLSGVGIGKRNRFIEDEYRKNQREAMTGANRVTYLQDGGQHTSDDWFLDENGKIVDFELPEIVIDKRVLNTLKHIDTPEQRENPMTNIINYSETDVTKDEWQRSQLAKRSRHNNTFKFNQTSPELLAENARRRSEYLENRPIRQKFEEDILPTVDNLVAPAVGVVSGVASFGNFIPHPVAQTIGKVGNVTGAVVDGYQAVRSLQEGDYEGVVENTASLAVPFAMQAKAGYRNSKWISEDHPLKSFRQKSGSRFNVPEYTRVNYREVFKPSRTMDKNFGKPSLNFNRALLGATAGQTLMDYEGVNTEYQEGGQIKQDPVSEVAQMLSEGIDPQEVFNMLIESGVPEQDAQAIIEQASQMFKFGGMLKEKKVKNYKYNKKTGNYEVEFE